MNENESTFEWLESSSVVLRAVDALAIYSNAKGDIVLRQKSSKGIFREEDSFIVIPRDRIDAVIGALEREKVERKPPLGTGILMTEREDEQRQA